MSSTKTQQTRERLIFYTGVGLIPTSVVILMLDVSDTFAGYLLACGCALLLFDKINSFEFDG